jgi:glycosyltransferase involved in cell wall biosynthesis
MAALFHALLAWYTEHKMKIGIDARCLTHPQPGGFKTYTENLVAGLASLDKENEYFLYVDREPSSHDLVPAQPNFKLRVVTGSLPMLGFPWREQIKLPQQASADRLDLFHSPCLTAPLFIRCPLVITVHDMIWAFPARVSKTMQKTPLSAKRNLMALYNYLVPKYATQNASAIITVSHAARESIIEHLRYPSDKIHVTWEAAASAFSGSSNVENLDALRLKYNLPSKFILAIGSADPRKNISTLLQAYSLLPGNLRTEYKLSLVWTHPRLADRVSEQLRSLSLEENVQFLQNVSNEELAQLYSAASLFVFPSLYEGFGLPLLEAMACGAPVVAANNSSIPEIVGDAARLFEATDPHGMSETIAKVLSNEQTRMGLIQLGRKRNAGFSWEKCARETLAVYRTVLIDAPET